MTPYVPFIAGLLVSDQTQLSTTRSRGGNTILLLKKTIFVVRMLQPPSALPRTSVLTQEMRLLSKHQSGAIYIASLKRYLKKHIDTSKNRKK